MEEIGVLKVSLGLDSADFTKSMRDMDRMLKATTAEFKAASSGTEEYKNSIDGLKAQSDALSRKFEVQQKAAEQLKERYEEVAKSKGEDSSAAQNLAIKYNKLVADMKNTEAQLEDLNGRITEQGNKFKTLADSARSAGEGIQTAGQNMQGVGEGLTAGLTVPLGAIGTAAIKASLDVSDSQAQMQASLGLTKDEATKLTNVASDIWKKGFGENLDEVTRGVATVKQNMKGLNETDLKFVTESAFTLSKVFGADIKESTKTASTLMKNFGIDSEQAMDIITVGFQKGGDHAGDLLDTLNEYAPQFKSMGFSADEMLTTLIKGAEKGAFNLDVVGDAMKEFNILAQEGNKTTTEGFKMICLDANKMGSAIAKGGDDGKKAFLATVAALSKMKDPLEQNKAGVALFGTKWEDVRQQVILAMGDATGEIIKTEGATKKASDAIKESFGERFQGVLRETKVAFEPLGKVALDLAESVLPKISAAIKDLSQWFSDLSPTAKKVTVGIGAIGIAIGPILVSLGLFVQSIGVLAAAFSPVGIAIAALVIGIGGLSLVIYKNWDKIKEKTVSTFLKMKDDLSNAFQKIGTKLTSLKDDFVNKFTEIKSKTVEIYNNIKNKLLSFIKSIVDDAKKYLSLLTKGWKAEFDILKEITTTAFSIIKKIASAFFQTVISLFKGDLSSIKEIWSSAWNSIKKTISEAVGKIHSHVTDIKNNVLKTIKSIKLLEVGKDIMNGLVDGLISGAKAVYEKAQEIAQNVEKTIKKALGIRSPSRVMIAAGEDTAEGLKVGLSKKERQVETQAKKVALKLKQGFEHELSTFNNKLAADKISFSGYLKGMEELKHEYSKVPGAIDKIDKYIVQQRQKHAKEAFSADKEVYEFKKKTQKLSYDEEVKYLQKLIKEYKKSTKERHYFETQLFTLKQKHSKEVFEQDKKSYENKKELEKLSLVEEVKYLESVSSKYKKNSDERRYFEENLYDAKKKIHEQLISLNDEYTQKVQDANVKLVEDTQKLTDEYNKAVEDRAKALVSFAGVFDEIKEKEEGVTGQQLLANLQGQVTTLEKWTNDLGTIAGKGIDEGLIKELQAMGPKAYAEIGALLTLTDEQLIQYNDIWKQKNELAKKQATEELTGMKTETDKKIVELTEATKKQLEGYKTEWETKIKSLTTVATNEFDVMKAKLPKIGEDAMKGLQSGMESMRGALEQTAQSIANSIRANIQSALSDAQSAAASAASSASNVVKKASSSTSGIGTNSIKTTTNTVNKTIVQNNTINTTKNTPSSVAKSTETLMRQAIYSL